jgi:hypothetical protein
MELEAGFGCLKVGNDDNLVNTALNFRDSVVLWNLLNRCATTSFAITSLQNKINPLVIWLII